MRLIPIMEEEEEEEEETIMKHDEALVPIMQYAAPGAPMPAPSTRVTIA